MSITSMSQNKREITKFETNIIKGLAIILLCSHHFLAMTISKEYDKCSIFSADTLEKLRLMTRVCVWLFAFCSAYGITKIYKKKNESNISFVFRRWISLMQSYWFAFLIYVVIELINGQDVMLKYSNNIWYLLIDIFGLGDFFGTPKLTGVFWYMTFAQVLIVFLPLLIELCRKFKLYTVIVAYFAFPFLEPGIVSYHGGNYKDYLIVVLLAILISDNEIFEKIDISSIKNKLLSFFGLLIIIAVGSYARLKILTVQFEINSQRLQGVLAAVVAVSIACFGLTFCKGILGKLLNVLGKYSGNIFYVHNAILAYYFSQIMWAKSSLVGLITLIVICVAISFVMEFIKKIVRYNVFWKKFTDFVLKIEKKF